MLHNSVSFVLWDKYVQVYHGCLLHTICAGLGVVFHGHAVRVIISAANAAPAMIDKIARVNVIRV